MVTLIGPGLNYPQDAVYPFSEKDEHGEKYDGAAHKYVMHFDKGQMPPVKGFWSLTMYDPKFFFVPNPINRYNLSQRNTFVTNADGSWEPTDTVSATLPTISTALIVGVAATCSTIPVCT